MKTLEQINRQNKSHDRHKSLRRKKFCKYTKGEHKFELVIPNFVNFRSKYTVVTFYEYWNDPEHHEHGLSFYYECSLCGKKKWEYRKRSALSEVITT